VVTGVYRDLQVPLVLRELKVPRESRALWASLALRELRVLGEPKVLRV